jgi:S-adenosylmethionine decarboxylase
MEGFSGIPVDRDTVARYLTGVVAHLGLRSYADPIIHAPSGAGKPANEGFDAFLPLIDSGISLYFWSARGFLSVVLYTCQAFDEAAAVAYTTTFFRSPEVVHRSF